MKSKGLGRGLSSLIGESIKTTEGINSEGLSYIYVENIVPNPHQPRVTFNSAELEELEDSIKQNGVLQPILIKPIGDNKYQIIAGERRWRASKMLGLAEIPAIIKDISEREMLELALIENIQRENLNALEEAESYKKLIDDHLYTQEKVAEIVSKSRSHIANLLRLLSLPLKIKQYLNDGLISLGHAKLLINNDESEKLVDIIVNNKLNVRETEDLLKQKSNFKTFKNNNYQPQPRYNKESFSHKSEDILALEGSLSDSLGTIVKIDEFASGGKISIHFDNLDLLDSIIQKLTNSVV